MRSSGTLLCLASGLAFGTMGPFGKLAYGEGSDAGTLLVARFTIASVLFGALLIVTGAPRPTRTEVRMGLTFGAVGYTVQAATFFLALQRIEAPLVSLVVYTFPAMVAAASVALGRERLTRRKVVALSLSLTGLALVVAGAGLGQLDLLGVGLALLSALVYTVYLLASERRVADCRPLTLSTFVCVGAAAAFLLFTGATGSFHPGAVSPLGWLWLTGLAAVPTVAAIGLLYAGLRQAGPTTSSILATVDPVVAVVLAFVIFGESLGPVQLAGGALVLSAVLVLQARLRAGRTAPREAMVAA